MVVIHPVLLRENNSIVQEVDLSYFHVWLAFGTGDELWEDNLPGHR